MRIKYLYDHIKKVLFGQFEKSLPINYLLIIADVWIQNSYKLTIPSYVTMKLLKELTL